MSEENKNLRKSTNKSDEVPTVAAGDVFEQISQGLVWLNERAWPLSGCILFISMLYLTGFIVEEKVPLSIASSSIIATLPVLFVMILLFIVLLVGFLLSPTAMLFTAIKKPGKQRLVDLLTKPDSGGGRFSIPKRIVIGWFLMPVVAVIFIGVVWLLFSTWNVIPKWLVNALVLLSLPSSIVLFIWLVIREKSLKLKLRDFSSDFWMATCFSVLPQFLIITYVFLLSIRLAQASGDSLVLLWSAVFLGVIALCFFQLIGAKFIAWSTQPDRSLSKSFKAGFIIVALLGAYPPTASLLTGVAFQITASGGRACAVLTWNSENPSGIEALYNPKDPNQSRNLRILIQVDEYYFARPKLDKAEKDAGAQTSTKVYFVPREIVSGIDDCPPENQN